MKLVMTNILAHVVNSAYNQTNDYFLLLEENIFRNTMGDRFLLIAAFACFSLSNSDGYYGQSDHFNEIGARIENKNGVEQYLYKDNVVTTTSGKSLASSSKRFFEILEEVKNGIKNKQSFEEMTELTNDENVQKIKASAARQNGLLVRWLVYASIIHQTILPSNIEELRKNYLSEYKTYENEFKDRLVNKGINKNLKNCITMVDQVCHDVCWYMLSDQWQGALAAEIVGLETISGKAIENVKNKDEKYKDFLKHEEEFLFKNKWQNNEKLGEFVGAYKNGCDSILGKSFKQVVGKIKKTCGDVNVEEIREFTEALEEDMEKNGNKTFSYEGDTVTVKVPDDTMCNIQVNTEDLNGVTTLKIIGDECWVNFYIPDTKLKKIILSNKTYEKGDNWESRLYEFLTFKLKYSKIDLQINKEMNALRIKEILEKRGIEIVQADE